MVDTKLTVMMVVVQREVNGCRPDRGPLGRKPARRDQRRPLWEGDMEPGTTASPEFIGVHHVALTVTDVESSIAWYARVFGAARLPARFPHYQCEQTGYGVLLTEPNSGLIFGLHSHVDNRGEVFDESRTGLDHLSFQVADRQKLGAWCEWLSELNIDHTGIRDLDEPFPYSTVVFRDPDNNQLEFIALR